ncbi:hypothetical protein CQW23_24318, partial [Capsicum baccatum]
MQSITNSTATTAAVQKPKNLLQILDVTRNIIDNYGFIINNARVNDPPVRYSHIHRRIYDEDCTFRMVHAAESLLKLVSELQKISMFLGFASLNDHVDQRIEDFTEQTKKTEGSLPRIGEETTASLKDLECHYYQRPYYCSAKRTSSL